MWTAPRTCSSSRWISSQDWPRSLPKPRVNLTRFHGVFAPNSAHRAQVTKAHRGKGASARAAAETDERTAAERRASMTWAQRLKRVFGIDIETCAVCGGVMRIIACIEDALVIEKILAHLDAKAAAAQAARPPPSRAPPEGRSSGEPTGAAQVA
jgi:pyruvate/2-oxoglutarate dehydrogenase complex dihydrolipoamide acyltransferase (E2) component